MNIIRNTELEIKLVEITAPRWSGLPFSNISNGHLTLSFTIWIPVSSSGCFFVRLCARASERKRERCFQKLRKVDNITTWPSCKKLNHRKFYSRAIVVISTLIKESDEGDLVVTELESSFSRFKADRVCCHPGIALPVVEIHGQKCLCCLSGSNCMPSSSDWCLVIFSEITTKNRWKESNDQVR